MKTPAPVCGDRRFLWGGSHGRQEDYPRSTLSLHASPEDRVSPWLSPLPHLAPAVAVRLPFLIIPRNISSPRGSFRMPRHQSHLPHLHGPNPMKDQTTVHPSTMNSIDEPICLHECPEKFAGFPPRFSSFAPTSVNPSPSTYLTSITRSRYPFCSENTSVRLILRLAAAGVFWETTRMEGKMLTFVAAAATAIGVVFYVVS